MSECALKLLKCHSDAVRNLGLTVNLANAVSSLPGVEIRQRKTQGEQSMSDLQVRIVDLAPMRCAGASGFGPEPEGSAWEAVLKWAVPLGLLSKPHRFFGYNN